MSDPTFHKDAFVLSWPRLEGFEKCAEQGCMADGFPGSGKCWEHTPSDGKAVTYTRMTMEEFKRRYPEPERT